MTKLPPIDTSEDVEKYEAFEEIRQVNFKGCSHRNVEIKDGKAICTCGAGWEGPRLNELIKLLKGERQV